MKTLILMRHAKSDWHTAARTDFDRPINERGKKAAPLMGQRLLDRDQQIELLISSPAKRAHQTAKRIAKQFDFPPAQIELSETIYEATLQALINLIQSLPDEYDNIMLIGHNPGFSELGQWLCPDSPDWLPTCGLLELELSIVNWRQTAEDCAELREYDYPKKQI